MISFTRLNKLKKTPVCIFCKKKKGDYWSLICILLLCIRTLGTVWEIVAKENSKCKWHLTKTHFYLENIKREICLKCILLILIVKQYIFASRYIDVTKLSFSALENIIKTEHVYINIFYFKSDDSQIDRNWRKYVTFLCHINHIY